MMKLVLGLFFLFPLCLHAQREVSSFQVTLTEKGIRVESPRSLDNSSSAKIKVNLVPIVFENKTSEKFYGQLKNSQGVLEHFSLKGHEKKVLEIERKDLEGLEFIPISPSYQEVPLKLSQGTYEIP